MSKINNVYILGAHSDLVGAGKGFGENVSAFVKDADEAKKAFSFGADEAYIYTCSSDIVKFLDGKDGLVLMPNTKQAKIAAAKIGAKLECGVSTEVFSVEVGENFIKTQKMLYGGLAIGTEKLNSKLAVVVVNSGTFEETSASFASDKEPKTLDHSEDARIKLVQKLPKQASSVDLNKAKKIVAIGRGVAKFEDLEMIKDFCNKIGAELGCTRPIAESEKWMEHERYIGISSVMPKPEIYIAIGVSGQIQHMVGAKDASKIIVINKDKNAPIFSYADYGIVGDLYKVLPQVINSLK